MPSRYYDFIVVGGGVIGTSIAYHLARAGAGSVLLVERNQIATGCTARSSAILRTHYTIPSNSALAWRSIRILSDFQNWLGDDEAESGFQQSGYLILGAERDAQAIRRSVAQQQAQGIVTQLISHDVLREIHPGLYLDDVAIAAHEPHAGWADPYLTAASFYRAGLRLGVKGLLHSPVRALSHAAGRVTGIALDSGNVQAGHVILAANVWTNDLLQSLGVSLPLRAEKHSLASFRAQQAHDPDLPVVKDLLSPNKLYFRPGSGGTVLAGDGDEGDVVDNPDAHDEGVTLDQVLALGTPLAARLPGFQSAGCAHTWSGLYDVSPDWNPILGPVADVAGLTVACGFSGHGFKLAPALGEALAASLLGQPGRIDLSVYDAQRFAHDALLQGAYGAGSIS